MLKIRATLTAAAVACTAALSVAGPAAAAGPVTLTNGVDLPVAGVTDVAVDPVHKRVLVTDFSTGTLHSLSYFGGAQRSAAIGADYGLAFSADYSTVYASFMGAHRIGAIDPVTLAVDRFYDLDERIQPRSLAVAGGKIWFSYEGGMGSLDPVTGKSVLYDLDNEAWVETKLATAQGTLVVANAWRYSVGNGDLSVYDVSSGEAVLKTKSRFGDGTLRDLELTPDGSTLIGFGDGCAIWKAPVTDPAAKTVTNDNGICRPQAVDINTDGRVAFGYGNQSTTADITTSSGEQFTLNRPDHVWRVAWEPGGNRLFAFGNSGKDWRFWPIHGSTPQPAVMTASIPATVLPGGLVQINGTLDKPGVVTLTRDYTNSPIEKQQVDRVTVKAPGKFYLFDHPPTDGPVTYTVSYVGTDTIGPVTTSGITTVGLPTPSLTLSHNNTISAYGSTVTVTAHLGATYTNRAVQIWADPYGTEPERLLRWTNVDAKGNLTASLKLTRTTAVQVKFTGDKRNKATSARSVLNTRASVALQPSREYKAAKIGTVPYRYYHANVHPYFLTTINPYPGRKQRLTLEVVSGGTWKVWRVLDLPLNTAGQSAFTLTGTHPVGAKYRARAGYLTTTSGDSVNYTNYSPYYYFTFTK
ncbi:hypothetical protein [Paractinoplanes atraurantiacus]|uniref:Streptogramin lyase n=1 Tax=Paractinoplanes atraurantiacus TaxID=1036182 RepID=A0A285EXS1_9ACTN|nr:hypothetical protein [Actinoplanes atraurantiacus]SNY03809.1 Streptogramin lyase [Actinoplanes atraurantiacus]